ncbi:hypothetical protein CMI47_04500 [Candidatus Pacearchaeota archaeon]|jgi:hypothetical protein|nr:hypothetical protein [Candidatus Pacearchaeota archaeon]|tara:strand:+ start:12674 stop:13690 length:1017 start_codon:yes stop_codon:yes gene_type:complete
MLGALLAAVVGAAGAASASKKSADAAKDARRAAQLQPFAVNTPFGNASIERGNLTVQDAAGTSLAPGFAGFAGTALDRSQQAIGDLAPGLNLDPSQVLQAAAGIGAPTAAAFQGAGANFIGAGQGALSALGTFDPQQFAQQRFDALSELARPGEEQAASSLANRLFAQGRVGGEDTAGGRAFGELAQAQSRAQTVRGILSQQAAMQEMQQRIGMAGQLQGFGGQAFLQGQQAANLEQARFLAALQGGGMTQGFNLQNIQGLLGLGLSGTQGIQEAFAPSRSAIQALLGGAELQMGGNATAAQAIMQGGNAQANLIGNATAGLAGGLMNFATQKHSGGG